MLETQRPDQKEFPIAYELHDALSRILEEYPKHGQPISALFDVWCQFFISHEGGYHATDVNELFHHKPGPRSRVTNLQSLSKVIVDIAYETIENAFGLSQAPKDGSTDHCFYALVETPAGPIQLGEASVCFETETIISDNIREDVRSSVLRHCFLHLAKKPEDRPTECQFESENLTIRLVFAPPSTQEFLVQRYNGGTWVTVGRLQYKDGKLLSNTIVECLPSFLAIVYRHIRDWFFYYRTGRENRDIRFRSLQITKEIKHARVRIIAK